MSTIERRHVTAKVTWDGSTESEQIIITGFSAGLQIELPDDFVGTAITYKRLSQDGATWLPIKKADSAISDTVSASGVHVLSVDLFGVDALKIVSNQAETCEGYLHGSS